MSDNALRQKLVDEKKAIEALLPKGWTYARLGSLAMSYAPKWDGKQICPVSFVNAVKQAAKCGLEPDGRRGHLVPYWNGSRSCHEVQFQPDYKGLVEAAKRADPDIATITGDCVYSGDEYRRARGDKSTFYHERPRLSQPRGEKEGSYALVIYKDGAIDWEEVTLKELEDIRACSKSRDKQGNLVGPQKHWQDEMDKKAAFKRLCKRLDMPQEVIDADNAQFDMSLLDRPALPKREQKQIALPSSPPKAEPKKRGRPKRTEENEPAAVNSAAADPYVTDDPFE